jgi:DnaJ domain
VSTRRRSSTSQAEGSASEQPALPAPSEPSAHPNGAVAQDEPIAGDPGLYGVLGLTPSASDAEIQSAYRQQASKLVAIETNKDIQALRQLNAAYEVLGTPVRRAEYDQARTQPSAPVLAGPSTFVRPDVKQAARIVRRRRPRQLVVPREAGLTEVLVLVLVVAFSALAGWQLVPRLSINLSGLTGLAGVIPAGSPVRRVIEPTVTPAPAATPTPAPSETEVDPAEELAAHFDGSTVTVASASPRTNSPQTVVVKLRRDGEPAANVEVWSTVQYRTTQERWPPAGTLRTDASGNASITFNVGPATPGYPVEVQVFAQVDDQQLSWTTTFTPR